MMKRIILLMLMFIPISLFVFFAAPKTQPSYELMYVVDSMQEAEHIAITYQLPLMTYSENGYATYMSDSDKEKETLLNQGFILNSKSTTTGVIRTGDPYREDQYALDMMMIDQAWTFTQGTTATIIAIIDSGIDTDHEEFTGRISPLAYNARTEQVGLAYVEDDTGHGTMVAGIIGAIKDNRKGIQGIMPNVTLLVIKANDLDNPNTTDDEAEQFSDSSIIEAIYYAVENGADVINLSLGGTYANPLTKTAVDYAVAQGVIVVAASGNDGDGTLLYPASFDAVISVGSVDDQKLISDFSNYNSKVDLSAPGEAIVTTYPDNLYVTASGTSFASPQVAGIIGLLISYNPMKSTTEIYETLISTAMDQGAVGRDNYYGYGIINAYYALTYSFFTVSFETDGGTLLDSLRVPQGETFTVDNPAKAGHTFNGWFKDQAFTLPFNVGVDVVTSDLILYAKFTPIDYQVTLVGFNQVQTTVLVTYGNTLNVTAEVIEGYDFKGWYYDSQFTILYQNNPIYSALTLYAKYSIKELTISYEINEDVIFEDHVIYGQTFTLYEPDPSSYSFLGWYTDQALTTPYTPSVLYEDLVLYGKVDLSKLHVNFYDSDLTTLLYGEIVPYGGSVTPPQAPIKGSTPSFDFVFIGWSEPTDFITSNVSVYPEYESVYDSSTVRLQPGIDTVTTEQSWVDTGLDIDDDLLVVVPQSDVDNLNPGTYEVIYYVYYDDEVIDMRIRIVHIIENSIQIDIELLPDITTIYVGDTYTDSGAISNIGEVVAHGDVDTDTPGVYPIIYEVTYGTQTVIRTKYVYVVEQTSQDIDEAVIFKKEEVMI